MLLLLLDLMLAPSSEYAGGIPSVGPDSAVGSLEYAGGGEAALGLRVGGEGFMKGLRKFRALSPSELRCLPSLLLTRDDEDVDGRLEEDDEKGFKLVKEKRRLVGLLPSTASSGLSRLELLLSVPSNH